jgi:hypothetical protein
MPQAPASAPYHVAGNTVVGEGPIILPDLCVQCGRPAEDGKRTEKKLFWAPPLLFLLILVNLLILLIVYLIVRKPMWVGFSQCRECRARQMQWLWSAAGAWLGVVVLVITAIALESAAPALGALALLVAALVFGYLGRAPIRFKNYKKPDFILVGFSDEFLDALGNAGEDVMGDRECRACGEPLRTGERECPVCGMEVRKRRRRRSSRAFE